MLRRPCILRSCLLLAIASVIISLAVMQELMQPRKEQVATCEVNHMINHESPSSKYPLH